MQLKQQQHQQQVESVEYKHKHKYENMLMYSEQATYKYTYVHVAWSIGACTYVYMYIFSRYYLMRIRDAIVMTSLGITTLTALDYSPLSLLLKTMWTWLRAPVIYTHNAVAIRRVALSFSPSLPVSYIKCAVCACFYVYLLVVYGTNATVLKIHLIVVADAVLSLSVVYQ